MTGTFIGEPPDFPPKSSRKPDFPNPKPRWDDRTFTEMFTWKQADLAAAERKPPKLTRFYDEDPPIVSICPAFCQGVWGSRFAELRRSLRAQRKHRL